MTGDKPIVHPAGEIPRHVERRIARRLVVRGWLSRLIRRLFG